LRRELQDLRQSSRSVDDGDDMAKSGQLPTSFTGSLPRLIDLQRYPTRPHTGWLSYH